MCFYQATNKALTLAKHGLNSEFIKRLHLCLWRRRACAAVGCFIKAKLGRKTMWPLKTRINVQGFGRCFTKRKDALRLSVVFEKQSVSPQVPRLQLLNGLKILELWLNCWDYEAVLSHTWQWVVDTPYSSRVQDITQKMLSEFNRLLIHKYVKPMAHYEDIFTYQCTNSSHQ